MIAILAILVAVVLVVMVVPAIANTVARSVVNSLVRGPSSGSIDQSLVEARLSRIEEAIDAMAVQIERLSDHQRALLGPDSGSSQQDDPDRLRTET